MVLVGAHCLPFASLYGMRMFLILSGVLAAMGVLMALYFSGTFSLGAWIGGLALFVFAWIGRSVATRSSNQRRLTMETPRDDPSQLWPTEARHEIEDNTALWVYP